MIPREKTTKREEIPFVYAPKVKRNTEGGTLNSDSWGVNVSYERLTLDNRNKNYWLRRRPAINPAGGSAFLYPAVSTNKFNSYMLFGGGNAVYTVTQLTNADIVILVPGAGSPHVVYSGPGGRTLTGATMYQGTSGAKFVLVTYNIINTLSGAITDGVIYVYNITTGTGVATTLPTTTIANNAVATIDGYTFYASANAGLATDAIYCSNLNAPGIWTSFPNPIRAEIYQDTIQSLAVYKNYLVAFGEHTTEFFWNPGNLTPPSFPFKRQAGYTLNIGYISDLCLIGDRIFFRGQERNGKTSFYQLENFKADEITSADEYRKIGPVREGSPLGFPFHYKGQDFYAIKVNDAEETPSNSAFSVYNIDSKTWSTWKFPANLVASVGMHQQDSSFMLSSSAYNTLFAFNDVEKDVFSRFPADPIILTPVTALMTTDDWDAGNQYRKSMSRLSVVGDIDTMTDTTLTLQYSDNQGATWKTARSAYVKDVFPVIYRLGTFVKRRFRMIFTGDASWRVSGLEADIRQGK